MLQIKIANSYFDIPNDIQVPISVLNPLVSESGFNEIFTYAFALQASPKNRAIYNRYVNKNAPISITFQSHRIATGIAQMRMDSNGISVMIKNDALNLRQKLENETFASLDLPVIPICNAEDSPGTKIGKWLNHMNSKLPSEESVNEGTHKFPPIYAAPSIEWAVNEDQSGFAINPTMWEEGFPANSYLLSSGLYQYNIGVDLPQKAKYNLTLPPASDITTGQYFIINSANDENKYYCWYSVDELEADPAPSGREAIRINIYSTYTNLEVCAETAQALALKINDFEVIDNSSGIIQIFQKKGGETTDPANINVGGIFEFTITSSGIGLIADANNNWRTTVSPCLRIAYLVQSISNYYQLNLKNEFLNAIPEFQALIHYSGKVLDQREDDEFQQFNVHGLEINLNEFKPNIAFIEVFKMLRNLFGVAFNYTQSEFKIEPIQLNLKAKNISKFCQPQFLITELENKSITYTYALGDGVWKYGDFYTDPSDTGVTKQLKYFNDTLIGNSTDTNSSEQLNFIPLVDVNRVPSYFKWPELEKSRVYNSEDFTGFDKFVIGLFRGNYTVNLSVGYNPLIDPTTTPYERLICTNRNEIKENFIENLGITTNYSGKFGTCSIYLDSEDSYLSIYANFLNQLKIYNQEIEKNLNLPFQEIIEIMRWKQPIHAIQQRNVSFRGIVKELKFTLGKSTISPATITYLVNKDVATGDFNADYSDDFNS